MKFLKFALLLLASYTIMSCSSDDDNNQPLPVNETEGLTLVKTFENANHKIAIFTESGVLTDGYNKVFMQFKNLSGDVITNVNPEWTPMMHMESMMHGGPHSAITKVSGKQSLYEGWLIFQMPGNQSEHWNLSIQYTIDGSSYDVEGQLDVQASGKQRVTTFTGSDGKKYILAYVEPVQPKVAINDMTAALYQMVSMNDFQQVNNFKVRIDPRMPSMGNHGAPNNEDLTQGTDGFYHGKLSLSMTGYWVINMMVENQNGEVLKGEEISESHPQSSLYFEIEF